MSTVKLRENGSCVTTVVFRGTALELMQRVGRKKSAILSDLVVGAIKNGSINEILLNYFTLAETTSILADIGETTSFYEHKKREQQFQHVVKKVSNEQSVNEPAKKETERLKLGGKNGFDY